MRDVSKLWSAGYALGATFDNTLVVSDDRVLNAEGLRFADEFVRHKALDAIGDLALAGAPLLGAYRSIRGGHKLNHAVLCALMADPTAWTYVDAGQVPARRPSRPGRCRDRHGGAGVRAGRFLNSVSDAFRDRRCRDASVSTAPLPLATFRADCPPKLLRGRSLFSYWVFAGNGRRTGRCWRDLGAAVGDDRQTMRSAQSLPPLGCMARRRHSGAALILLLPLLAFRHRLQHLDQSVRRQGRGRFRTSPPTGSTMRASISSTRSKTARRRRRSSRKSTASIPIPNGRASRC